jgi:hypothetical protein
MNTGNFLDRLPSIVNGVKAIKQEVRVPMTTGVDSVSLANSATTPLLLEIPLDYDEARDKCTLILNEEPGADESETTSLGITTAQTIYRDGAAADATTSSAVAEDATTSVGKLCRKNELDISGRGYEAGDKVALTVTAVCTNAATVTLLGARLVYGSTIVAYDTTNRSFN